MSTPRPRSSASVKCKAAEQSELSEPGRKPVPAQDRERTAGSDQALTRDMTLQVVRLRGRLRCIEDKFHRTRIVEFEPDFEDFGSGGEFIAQRSRMSQSRHVL